MRAKNFGATWLQFLVVAALLLGVAGPAGAFAQVSAPLPSTAQVIAQSVESVSGGSMVWQTAPEQVPSADTDPLVSTDQFLFAEQGQILASHESGERELVSTSQAIYTSGSWQANSTTGQPAEARTISLITAAPASGIARSQPFEIEAGDYNLQLTRGILREGQTDAFQPENDYPYIVIVTAGTVSLSAPGDLETTDVATGIMTEWSGDAELLADGDATYLIASIGAKLPTAQQATVALPTLAAPGEVLVLFWDCAETDYPVETREECELVWEPISASFTMFSQGTPLTRTDSTQLPDGSWIYESMTAGEWEFQLFMPDGSTPPTYTVLGDAEQRDGQWYVTVNPGERSVANVMMYGRPGTEASALTVSFMECPQDWNPAVDLSSCSMAVNEPNMQVTGPNVTLNTQGDATMPGIGTYEFQDLPAGTYQVEVQYNDTWTPETTHMMARAYSDGAAWYVDVAEGVPANVVVVHTAPATTDSVTPPTVATGYVVITQEECGDATAESICPPSFDPWDVRLTNIETGEIWWMSEWGYNAGDGQWIMQLPTGSYTVEVPDTRGWMIDYPGQVDVLNDQESYVHLRGNP
jgi:hypothetical protein